MCMENIVMMPHFFSRERDGQKKAALSIEPVGCYASCMGGEARKEVMKTSSQGSDRQT